MTDSADRPLRDRSETDAEQPAEGRHGPTADGGHLREDAAPMPVADAQPQDGAAFRRRRQRSPLLVPVVAAAVVAALIGGAAGAGIAIAANSGGGTSVAQPAANGSGQGVVINDPQTATPVAAVAAKASPSVVTISVTSSSASGTGSGIVLSADGYVLTNNHVATLDGATSDGEISVTTSAGRIYSATLVGTDPLNDLAVIRLRGAEGLTPATFADSDDLNVGDAVVAIGAPLDLPNTVTTGIVSALDRSIAVASSAVQDDSGSAEGEESPFNFWNFGGESGQPAQTANIYLSVLQTDAAINPGNSGGALLDSQGRVIGVNVAIAGTGSSSGAQSGSIGVGFSIPSNVAKRIADELVAGETPTHGQLGVQSLPGRSTAAGDVAGIEVSEVDQGTAAAAAGIEAGDVITAVGGVAVTNYTDLAGQVRSYPGGSRVDITFVRDGRSQTVQATLGTTES